MSDWTDYVYKSMWSDGMGSLDFEVHKNTTEIKSKKWWQFWK